MNEYGVVTQPVAPAAIPMQPQPAAPAVMLMQPPAAQPVPMPDPPEPRPEPVKTIQFTAYPAFVVVWPVIVLGFLFALLYAISPAHYPERVASTLWLMALFAVMMALGIDFDSGETAFIIMSVVVVLLVLQLIAFEWQIAVFSWIGEHLRTLEVRVSAHMMLSVSILFTVPYLLMLLLCRMNKHAGRQQRDEQHETNEEWMGHVVT